MSAPVEEPRATEPTTPAGGPEPPPDPLALLKQSNLIVDSALSPAVFVGVNLVAGLRAGAFAALGLAVVIMAYRLARRQELQYAVGGVVGTAIAVAIVLRTGSTEDFFWPKVLTNSVIFVALTASVLFKRPAIGFLTETLLQWPARWWRHDRVRPAFSEWTLVWAASAALKAVVYLLLILAGETGALLGVSVAFGYPMTAALGLGGYLYIRARLKRLGAPPLDAFRPTAAATA